MSAPSSDVAAIRQIIRALHAADHVIRSVDNGGGRVKVTNEADTIEECNAADEAYMFVTLPDGTTGWIRFVLGNEPFEVVCDNTTNLEPVLAPLTEKWDA